VTSYLVLFASTHNGLVNPDVLGVSAGLFSLMFVYWLLTEPSNDLPLQLPGLAFWGILALTTLTSLDPRRSFSEFWLVGISFFLFFFTAHLVRRGFPAELVHKVLLIVVAVVMAFAWLEALNWYRQYVNATGNWLPRMGFRLSLPNFFSVLLNVLLMVAIARWFAAPSVQGRILLGLWILSAFGLIFFTSSRGGWLGTAAGLGTLGLLYLPKLKQKGTILWQAVLVRRYLLGLAAIIGLMGLGGLGWLLYHQMHHPTHVPILDSRSYLWRPAWQAFLRSPLLGEGPYRFASLFLRTTSAPPGPFFVYSHSIYLDILSGSGLLGLLAASWLWIAVIRNLLQRLHSNEKVNRAVTIGGLAAMGAFLVHGIVDSVHHTIPTSAWVMAIMMGAAITSPYLEGKTGYLNSKEPGKIRITIRTILSRPWSVAIGILVVILSWINLWMILPLQKGVEAADLGNWHQAVAQFNLAVQRDRQMVIVYQQLGLANSILASEGNPTTLDQAIHAFEKVVALDPDWSPNYANLGALYRARGDLQAARSAFRQAANLANLSPIYWLNLAETEEALGDSSSAILHYQKVLTMRPDWSASYFWRSSSFRNTFLADWAKNTLPSEEVSLSALESNLLANQGYSIPYIQLAERYILMSRFDEAEKLVEQASLAYFNNEEERLELSWERAQLAARRGDLQKAIQNAQAVREGYLHQGAFGPGSYGLTVYAQLIFRRPAMQMDFVPQMTLLIPDVWGSRMLQLVEWYQMAGDNGKAEELMVDIKRNIPDFEYMLRP